MGRAEVDYKSKFHAGKPHAIGRLRASEGEADDIRDAVVDGREEPAGIPGTPSSGLFHLFLANETP